ncbi:MAG: hypothetical protein FHP92_12915 [Denitromonas halophila]|nr:MAG: hypothetical protein FHP92_12915 [Denitromonas halophila]
MTTKDTGLRIRVERELRDAFQQACLSQGRRASEVLREFMQAHVDEYRGGQGDLFAPAAHANRLSHSQGRRSGSS